ncbi:MAG: ATP-binding cassette domain-containing protein [Muribaculaceae bacterium]|nr:ATP-binding cassette domain-containing protein [Muribaculaceae bacterium]
MIKVNNLTFGYRRKATPVIDDVTLEFPAGKIYGLLGKNGVGKSTLLYLIAGLLTPGEGNVEIDGTVTRRRLPSTLSDIVIVPEEVEIPGMSLLRYASINSPFYPRFSMPLMLELASTFDIDPSTSLGFMSMGQRKKAYICFALACNSRVLLMDEPTNGLDIPGKAAFRRAVAAAMADDRTIIISTHQIHDIENLIDHVIIMRKNEISLNSSIESIASRLIFTVTPDLSTLPVAPLYSQPAPGGYSVVLPNDGLTDESRVDMELLFSLIDTNPSIINILNDYSNEK